jgi:thiol-disulfide isomerase/thioredoxin
MAARLAACVGLMAMLLPGCGAAASTRGAITPSAQPSIAGRTLDGKTVNLASWRGHPVVLVFWGAWCGPCHDEQPRLNAAYARWAPRGVGFLGVDMRDDTAAALKFQRQLRVPYSSVADPDVMIAAEYDVPAAPALAFVDVRGRVGDRVLGGLGVMTEADFDQELKALLRGK